MFWVRCDWCPQEGHLLITLTGTAFLLQSCPQLLFRKLGRQTPIISGNNFLFCIFQKKKKTNRTVLANPRNQYFISVEFLPLRHSDLSRELPHDVCPECSWVHKPWSGRQSLGEGLLGCHQRCQESTINSRLLNNNLSRHPNYERMLKLDKRNSQEACSWNIFQHMLLSECDLCLLSLPSHLCAIC